MTKSHEILNETVKDSRQLARKVEDRRGKPRQHRYERRKVKEIMRHNQWFPEFAA